ncbi:MAG: phage tail protein [Myxococcales bacterium]|nr:phage tail protein [Myxococcales bacterium]
MADRRDPYTGFNFMVELDGLTRAGFKEASGIETSVQVFDYREGTDVGNIARKLPGQNQASTITLRRGISDDRALYDWHRKAATGSVDRRTISIVLRDETGAEKIRWNIKNAWPSKWTGPSLDAGSNDVAIEALELVHEGLEVQKW